MDHAYAEVNGLTIARIPDGSHWVVREHPERVNRLIRDFLAPRGASVTKDRR
jgi:pimeloyl-ACP methyl ester carboxylesterase